MRGEKERPYKSDNNGNMESAYPAAQSAEQALYNTECTYVHRDGNAISNKKNI